MLIVEYIDKHFWFDGEIELNKSYFSDCHKGQLNRGDAGKVPVFGFLECGGKVYTKVIRCQITYFATDSGVTNLS